MCSTPPSDVAPEERQKFLNRCCGDDEALRSEAASLLSFDASPGRIFEAPVAKVAAGLMEGEPTNGTAPRRMGPYKVLREIGRGGTGTVYLATRDDDQCRLRVALKVIHPDRMTEELRRRFHRERQILASLDHPNVARFLDAGTTDAGLTYVVMELVEGQPIDRYCESQGLTLEERLELFRTVCSAVHDAHRNLIVHRDLKPGNILVTAKGIPKLLDFGIAKLLNPELCGEALCSTAPSLLPMTPAYASPEQVRGDPITTASDVYSLGVLLYQLLAGALPYRFERPSLWEVERLICESEPPRPSAAAHSRAWRAKLEGDLDHIVMMALSKEPRRRYGSAEQLAEDLGRYLTHQPVTARKSTWATGPASSYGAIRWRRAWPPCWSLSPSWSHCNPHGRTGHWSWPNSSATEPNRSRASLRTSSRWPTRTGRGARPSPPVKSSTPALGR